MVTVLVAGITAFITALVAAPVRLAVDRRLQRSKVAVEYEYEQRRALRTKIGAYHGRVLEAALDLNYRLANLRKNREKDWLDIKGEYRSPAGNQYYFRTTVYRFVLLEGLASRFEREAVFVDARIADGRDESFVFYAKAFRWVMTDVALFGDLEYDASRSSDHFFNDHLRQLCMSAWGSHEVLEFVDFEKLVVNGNGLDGLLEFFDGLRPGQLRWDRLMALWLLLMAFINTFGYKSQLSEDAWFDKVAEEITHVEVAKKLLSWLPKLGLESDPGAKKIQEALRRRLLSEKN